MYKQKWLNKNFNRKTLQEDAWNDNWLFIHDENIAPLLIGEWGGFLDGGDNQKWMEALRDQIIEDRLHHTFWAVNPNSGDTGGLLKNDWLTFDEAKYAILRPTLWTDKNGKFVGLDHEIPLGSRKTGVSLSEHYGKRAKKKNNITQITKKTRKESYSGENHPNKTISQKTQSSKISIKSPKNNASLSTNEQFTINVTYKNAAGFKVSFNGKTQLIINRQSATFTTPNDTGNYPITVSAIDTNRNALTENKTINIVVNQINTASKKSSTTCTVSTPSVWPGGFTINEIRIKNDGSKPINNWTATLNFAENMSLSSGWNAKYSGQKGTIKASNETYNGNIGPGESATFGLQGSYTGDFILPTCNVTKN